MTTAMFVAGCPIPARPLRRGGIPRTFPPVSFDFVLKGPRHHRSLKNSTLFLLLGGAALQRCGKGHVLITALAAEVKRPHSRPRLDLNRPIVLKGDHQWLSAIGIAQSPRP